LANQKFQIGAIDRFIISLQQVSNECGIDHLLLSSGLRPDELDKCRPDLVHVAELFLDMAGIIS
jgi:hypothetical protein